jgi:hypothetical protein
MNRHCNDSSRRTQPPRLGIDIGRVIIAGDGPDTHFLDGDETQAMAAPAVDGALPAIAELVRRFEGRVWPVSKCGPRVEGRRRRWLDAHGFYAATGVDRERLRFCRQRPDKAVHARALELSHFIDDRADVLAHLDGVVAHRFLFGPQRQPPAPRSTATPVLTWAALLEAVAAGW